jgi:hypothetical protein
MHHGALDLRLSGNELTGLRLDGEQLGIARFSGRAVLVRPIPTNSQS